MSPALALALAGLAAGCAAYWLFMFWRLLPLERRLRAVQVRAEELRGFALEVLDLRLTSGSAPSALKELGRRSVDGLHRRSPQLALAWLQGAADPAETALVAARGRVWEEPSQAPGRLDSELLRRALREGGLTRTLAPARGGEDEPLLRRLADHGFCVLRLMPWGRPGGSRGLLAAADRDPQGSALAAAEPLFEIALRLGTSLARVVDEFARLSQVSDRLQGGLTSAMDELTSAHARLVQKSREVKTLHEVAQALVSCGAQAQSLRAIVSIVAQYLRADLVAFLLPDEAGAELVTQPGAFGLESAEQLYRIALSRDDASSARVFKSRRPFLTGDAQNDPGVVSRFAKLWNLRSLMVLPLLVEERCIGVMRVGSFEKDRFTPAQLEVMTIIAEEAAVIVETAILNSKLSQVARQLADLDHKKSEFVSTVSHEFKTPLTALSGFLSLMVAGETGPLNPQQLEFLRISQAQVERLTGLVCDLLEYSRLESNLEMAQAPVALDQVVRASVANHRRLADGSGKDISVEVRGEIPAVLGDAKWLGLAVDNLVSNAVKFTRPGGRVAVSVAVEAGALEVCVADEGIGIHPDDQGRIFEKFFRARNRGEVPAAGTGLGLAIAKEAVARHGGRLWFESELGRGSKFHVSLPVPRPA